MEDLAISIFIICFVVGFITLMIFLFKSLAFEKNVYHVVWSFGGRDQTTKYDIFIKATDIAKVWKMVERKYGKHGTIFYHRIEVVEKG